MSIKKTLSRVGIVLSVAVMVGCDGGDNPGGNNNNTVTINGLTWTKKNIDVDGGWCYDNESSNCAKYGRLYGWSTAKSVCQNMGDGWRLPTNEDWNNLVNYAGHVSTKLRSKSGWAEYISATDDYGFSALPGGSRDQSGSQYFFRGAGLQGYWWSATNHGESNAYLYSISYDQSGVSVRDNSTSRGASVRCVKN